MTQSVHNRVPDCLENENSLIRKASIDAGLRQRTSHFDEGELADDDERRNGENHDSALSLEEGTGRIKKTLVEDHR